MAERAPFPRNQEEFANDPRISYHKTTRTYLLEDENGEEWEWMKDISRWSKTMDQALMEQQQEIYKVAGVDDDTPALNPALKRKAALDDSETNKKAKTGNGATTTANNNANDHGDANANATATTTTAIAMPADPPKASKAVFVSGLPLDVNTTEIRDQFSKCGIIATSVGDDKERIKLYYDDNDNFKGEAMIVFHREEAANNAVFLYDQSTFYRDFGQEATTISVVIADNSYKRENNANSGAASNTKSFKPKPSREQVRRKAEEMNRKLADWSDDDVSTMPETSSRFDKVVVLKNVFDPKEIEDHEEIEEIANDMREGAQKYGSIKNVTVFDLEADGIVTIRFTTAEAANACMRGLSGKGYDGRPLKTSIATGYEKFKKSRKTAADKDAEEAKRLAQFSKDIEGDAANGDTKV